MTRSPRRLFGFMAATRSSRRPHFVPRLLVLEDRTVPSTLLVTNNLDPAPAAHQGASAVHATFDLSTRAAADFPSDRFTVADPT
jgi:hypothetical protein